MREAIASALDARGLWQDADVLDLYAGTGALGLEALSRGARRVLAIDSSSAALACVRTNVRALELQARHETHKLELSARDPEKAARRIAALYAARGDGGAGFTLVLADPPYADAAALPALIAALAGACLAEGAAALLEHARKTPLPVPPGFAELARYQYGDTAVLLAMRAAEVAS